MGNPNFYLETLTNPELNDQLGHGDQRIIATKSGFSYEYVGMVLRGLRNNDLIRKMAIEIIKNRNSLTEQLDAMIGKENAA